MLEGVSRDERMGRRSVALNYTTCHSTFEHHPAAPSRPPRSVRHTVTNTTTLTLQWLPPAQRFQNGVIRSYSVNITEVLTGRQMHFNTSSTSLAVPSLQPYYEYEYTVAAYTVSVGPYSAVNRVQMPEEGELRTNNDS